jgi:hypothetical protein
LNFLSIGESCQTAYQIRRHCDINERYIFDWVISSPETISRVLLQTKPDDILKPENLQIVDNGVKLLDKGTLIRHQHDFKLDSERKHNLDMINSELNVIRDKYIYLLEKTRQYIKKHKPILVYYDWSQRANNLSKVKDLRKSLSNHFGFDIKILFVSESLIENSKEDDNSFLILSVDNSKLQDSNYRWRGCDDGWDKVFNKLSEWNDK